MLSANHIGATPLTLIGDISRDGDPATDTYCFYLSGSNTASNTISGSVTEDGTHGYIALIKQGSGKWVLSGAGNYTGGTTISAGRLTAAKKTALGTGAVSVTTELQCTDTTTDATTLLAIGPLTSNSGRIIFGL